jgi:hypothetical protein
MNEPSPNPEQQILEESTQTPLANGTPIPAAADIEMPDSIPTPVAVSEVRISLAHPPNSLTIP